MILVAALVCGAFGIGTSEFLVMGLLPQIAASLSGQLYRRSPKAAMATTGWMTAGYALGVATGTVVMPFLLRKSQVRAALIWCAASMMLWTLLTALSPSLPVAITFRFLAALAHATYTGLASVVVARLLGPNHQGRGNAVVIGGLTAANLVGVPLFTAAGSGGAWRVMIGLCSILFAAPVVALVFISLPALSDIPHAAVRARATTRQSLTLMAAITLLAGGGFAIMTFVAPISRWSEGSVAVLPVAAYMAIFGVGMNAGNVIGGWAADRAAGVSVVCFGAVGITGTVMLLLRLWPGVTTGVGIAMMGILLGGVNPGAMVLYMRELPHRPRLAASLASGTANLGSFIGSLAGGALLATRGVSAAVAGGFALTAIGLLVFLGRGSPSGRSLAASGGTAAERTS
ncbi:MFS transporter [Leekyejoonella antrihumi]|nr:MFS transporter [Leekyejoonella antrihumi]